MDKRIENLAKVIIHYSIGLKAGQLLKIKAEPIAEPFVKALYKEAIAVGAYPYTEINFIDVQEIFFRDSSDEQLKFISPIRELEIDKLDAYIGVWGSTNTKFLSGINPQRQQIANKAAEPLMNKFFKREILVLMKLLLVGLTTRFLGFQLVLEPFSAITR